MRQGMTQEQAESVLKGEKNLIVRDVHPRPVNPILLEGRDSE